MKPIHLLVNAAALSASSASVNPAAVNGVPLFVALSHGV